MNYKKRGRQQRAVDRLEEDVLAKQKRVKSQEKQKLRKNDIEYGFVLEAKDKLKKAQKTLINTKHNLDQD